MRGAPHNGFAWLLSRIKWRISAATFSPPGRRRDFRVQYQANARRCQAITVSGRTMCRLQRQPGHHRESKTHVAADFFTIEAWTRRGRERFGTPRTDPDGRSLAHPVLISDEWRQSASLSLFRKRVLVCWQATIPAQNDPTSYFHQEGTGLLTGTAPCDAADR